MNKDGSALKQLTSNSANDGDISFTPDSKKIVFASYISGNFEIYQININGSDLKRLTDNTANDGLPVVSVDGTHIMFCSDRDDDFDIFIMNADGTEQIKMTDNYKADIFAIFEKLDTGSNLDK